MKQAKLFLMMLFAILGFGTATAVNGTVVQPYLVDFEGDFSSSTPGFVVDAGWDHIAPSNNYDGYGPYYMTYSHSTSDGIGGSKSLKCYQQYAGDNQGGAVVNDVLVTPTLEGTVKLYVQDIHLGSAPSWVEFYAVNDAGTELGDVLGTFNGDNEAQFVPCTEEGYEGWSAITLEITTPTRVGIRAQYTNIDNLTATKATIVDVPKLAFESVTKTDDQGSTAYFNQGADGSVLARFLVRLKNTGTVDLVAGETENYTLSLKATYAYNANTVYFQLNGVYDIPVDIAAGEISNPFVVEISVPADKVALLPSSNFANWYLIEDVTGNTGPYLYAGIVKYESKFLFDKKDTSYNNGSKPTTTPVAFGMITESTELNYEIYNGGTAPLTINSIEVPSPFTTNWTLNQSSLPIELEAGEKIPVNIQLPATTQGIFTGDLTINYTEFGKEAETYTLGVTGTVIDPSKNLITFDDGAGESYFLPGSVRYNVYISSEGSGDSKNYFLRTSTGDNRLYITPLMTAETDESFSFDAKTDGSYSGCTVVVKISKDRQNWTELSTTSVSSSQWTTFSAQINEAGDYYIGFELTKSFIDNIYGLVLADAPGHDLLLVGSDVPTAGKQNKDYSASIKVGNVGPNVETAGEYTATLYVGGEAVATDNSKNLPVANINNNYNNGEEENYTVLNFTFRPKVAGTYPAYIEVKSGDAVVKTDEVELVVEEEVASSEAGTAVASGYAFAPVEPYYLNSETVSLYTGEMLGLTGGEKIKSITYKAYCTDAKAVSSILSIYYEWTDDETQPVVTQSAMYDVTGMIPLIENETHSWEQTATSGTEFVDYIVINFDEDNELVYPAGKSLRIVARAIKPDGATSSDYKRVYFEKAEEPNGTWCYGGRSDYDPTLAVTHSARDLPAIHLALDVEPITFSGTVLGENEVPVMDATVTLYDEVNDVQYQNSTDSEGKFSVDVVQHNGNFKVTVTASGYEDLEDETLASFEDGSITDVLYVLTAKKKTINFTYDYTTISYDEALDFGEIDDVKVYIVKDKGNGKTKLVPVESKQVPAGAGVVLKGIAGESYDVPVIDATEETLEGNLLVPTLDEAYEVTTEDVGYVYRFVYGKTSQTCGFQKAKAGQTVSKNKAYLRLTEAGATEFIGFDDIDGITEFTTTADENAPMYDLSGRRVNSSYKGIVIQNGVKRVLK